MNITKAEKKEKKPETLYFGDRGLILGKNTEVEDWNKNVCVFGGREDLENFVKANVLQYKESFIITDYKGEIFGDVGRVLLQNNYRVHVLDLSNFFAYDSFNPLYYIREAMLDEYREQLVDALVESIAAKEKALQEEKKLLLKSIIYYYYEETDRYFNFSDLLDFIMDADENYTYDIDFNTAADQGDAIFYYSKFREKSENVRKQVIIDLVMNLYIFSAEFVKALTATESLQLDLLHDEKCAIFILTGDSTSPMTDILTPCIYSYARIMRDQDQALHDKLQIPTGISYPIRYYYSSTPGKCYELCNDQFYTYLCTRLGEEELLPTEADFFCMMTSSDYQKILRQMDWKLDDEVLLEENQVLIIDREKATGQIDAQYPLSDHREYRRTENGRVRFFDQSSGGGLPFI